MLPSRNRGGEPDTVQQGEAVDDPEYIADQEGCDPGRTATACHEPDSREPFSRSAPPHGHFEQGVVQKEDRRARRHDKNEPRRVGHEGLGQAPAAVVDERAHDEPADRDDGPDHPVGEEGKCTHAGPRHRQGHLHARDTVDDQVRQGLHHSSAASSSA